MKRKNIDSKKAKVLSYIVSVVLVLSLVGITYAFFDNNVLTSAIMERGMTTSLGEQLYFEVGSPLEFVASASNFGRWMDSITDSTYAYAHLRSSNEEIIEGHYYIYFAIEENTFKYTADRQGNTYPEIILRIKGPEGYLSQEDVPELTYVTDVRDNKGATFSGFDITRTQGTIALAENRVLRSDGTRNVFSEKWEIEITFVNLEEEQYESYGSKLVGKLYAQRDAEHEPFMEEYAYKGEEEVLTIEHGGYYKLETWGAQGGNATYSETTYSGGYGGYSVGYVYLPEGTNVYINVGGQGTSVVDGTFSDTIGYNGGGRASYYSGNSAHGGGGGATSLALVSGKLSELNHYLGDYLPANKTYESPIILQVAGGGGGASASETNPSYSGNGGSGGGYLGTAGLPENTTCYSYGGGGTQRAEGTLIACETNGKTTYEVSEITPNPATFGKGANYGTNQSSTGASIATSAGGGGGFYGGQAGYRAPGGGGSGYIGNTNMINKHMTCYNCATINYKNTEVYTRTTTSYSSTPIANRAKSGDGYAKITYCGLTSKGCEDDYEFEKTYAYSGKAEELTIDHDGYYKIELWGAQGNFNSDRRKLGGLGGYTSGSIYLEEGEVIYTFVGENRNDQKASFNAGTTGGTDSDTANGGSSNGYGGGGATDVRCFYNSSTHKCVKNTDNLAWDNSIGLSSRIMVAGGGGGASSYAAPAEGGAAGGLTGYSGTTGYYSSGSMHSPLPAGGSQTAGGSSPTNLSGNGSSGSFGKGGNGNSSWGSGGGGGYYGGAGGGYTSYSVDSGAGGSSYVSGYKGCVAIASENNVTPKSGCTNGTTDVNCSIHYSELKFSDPKLLSGKDIMPTHDGTNTMTGNSGSGYAKITYCGQTEDSCDEEKEETNNNQSSSSSKILANYITTRLYTTNGSNNLYYHDSNLANSAGDNSVRYSGASNVVENWVCFGYTSESDCSSSNYSAASQYAYRIIGAFDYDNNTKYNVKLIKNTAVGTATWNSYNTGTLNTTYLSNLGTWADYIATPYYFTGSINYVNVGSYGWSLQVTPKQAYTAERSGTIVSDKKIWLMYVSDYGYAASPEYWNSYIYTYDQNAKNYDWLQYTDTEWTIVPVGNYSDTSWAIYSTGKQETRTNNNSFNYRPVFYLNNGVKFSRGTGTLTDPYIIEKS